MTERIWYVKQCVLFEQLSVEQLVRLEANARIQTFPKNVSVYCPTDASEYVFVLLRGRVRICSYTPDGKQAILAFIEPGEIFGELVLIHPEGHEDHAETMLPSTVAMIPKINIDRLLTPNSSFSLGSTKFIGWRHDDRASRLRSLLFRSNRDRLVHLLLDLAEQYGRPAHRGTLIDIRLSHQELANVIGCTRETVTILLGELQSERRVEIMRQRIVLIDPCQIAADVGVLDFRAPSPNPLTDETGRNHTKSADWKRTDSQDL